MVANTGCVNVSYTTTCPPYVINLAICCGMCLQVCQYGNGTCGSFEALTQRGYLNTDIANTGYVNASYTVTVSNCSAGITNPVAQQSTIGAQSVLRFTFDIYPTSNLARDSSCTVGLINSLGSPLSFGLAARDCEPSLLLSPFEHPFPAACWSRKFA